jgi:hypothetical protein
MPRIAAAISVFAMIAVLIFINIKTYPTVWEMVGASPWFAQGGESSSQEISAQPEMVAEKVVKETAPKETAPKKTTPPRPELKSLADSKSPASDPPPKPAGLGPRLDLKQKSTPDLPADSVADNAAKKATKNKAPASDPKILTGATAAYRGLNLGPIKIPQSGVRCPTEISPKMKYAAKPPILETPRKWNPERPLVPVQLPQKAQKPNGNKPVKSPNAAASARGNPSCDKAAIRHLPPIDPNSKDRPIRISIPTPDTPIPIYPRTERDTPPAPR